jgi:transmembrane sensor
MDKLARDLELAREELAPQWTDERSARLFAATRKLGQRRATARIKQLSVGAIAAALLVSVGLQQRSQAPQPMAQKHDSQARTGHSLKLSDGSRAELVGEHSELEVIHDAASRVRLRLMSGRAHFDVVPDTTRSFVVEAQPYRVEVIGTVFDVERGEREVSVSVTRGKVRVYGPQGAEDLVAGQIKRFERGDAASAKARPAAPAVADEPEPSEDESAADSEASDARGAARPHARAPKRGASWRSLSQSGQYEAAFESLKKDRAVEDDPAALMDAADAARLSGHAEHAVGYLAQVVSRHPKSPVAPLAAFTLGRVYLDKLGQPDRASDAFALAQTLAPNGSLAPDALAREVEALSKGGNAHKAYLRAQEYLRRYPNGQRLRAVQLYGGLE